jgi:hypothetical protein
VRETDDRDFLASFQGSSNRGNCARGLWDDETLTNKRMLWVARQGLHRAIGEKPKDPIISLAKICPVSLLHVRPSRRDDERS